MQPAVFTHLGRLQLVLVSKYWRTEASTLFGKGGTRYDGTRLTCIKGFSERGSQKMRHFVGSLSLWTFGPRDSGSVPSILGLRLAPPLFRVSIYRLVLRNLGLGRSVLQRLSRQITYIYVLSRYLLQVLHVSRKIMLELSLHTI